MSFILFFICLVALTIWRLWPAFASPNLGLGTMGDAAGGMGWISDIGRQFDTNGWAIFLNGDQMRTTFLGAGLMDPIPVVNPAWRLLFVGVTRLGLSPDNNYDLIIAIQFILAGVVGWFFAATFGLKAIWRFVFVFIMVSFENTSMRLLGHNGLVFLYGPMLSLIFALKYCQEPSKVSAAKLLFTCWLSFLSNEYFGYFGLWACGTLVVAYQWESLRLQPTQFLLSQCRLLWPAFILFFGLMCLSHPSVTVFKIAKFFGLMGSPLASEHSLGAYVRVDNPTSEFLLYGLKNPLALFDSWFIPLPENVSRAIYGRNTHEFSFRWGLILPLFVWWVWRKQKGTTEKLPHRRILISICIVTVLLGMRPDVGLSLGWFTRFFAPMFRVGARAQFISLLVMLLLFMLSVQWLWEHRQKYFGTFKTVTILAIVSSLVTFEVARSGPVFGHHAVFPISSKTSLAQTLAKRPKGMTLLAPAVSGDFESESYFLSAIHNHPVLNSQFKGESFLWGKKLFSAADLPNADSLRLLENCGIRYLLVNRQPLDSMEKRNTHTKDFVESWAEIEGVNLVDQNPSGAVFELPRARDWPLLDIIVPSQRSTQVEQASLEFLRECVISNSLETEARALRE